MTSLAIIEPKDCMDYHLSALKEYVQRVVVHGEELSPVESYDQAYRMEEFLAVGCTFNLTYKEMTHLLFGGLFDAKRECGCPSCRSREGADN